MTRTLPGCDWPTVWHFYSPAKLPESEGSSNENDPPDRARWVLALGIVSLVVGPLGVFAWMAGNAVLSAIADGRTDPTCESNARAGRLLGLVAICMFTFKVTVLLPLAVVFWHDIPMWLGV